MNLYFASGLLPKAFACLLVVCCATSVKAQEYVVNGADNPLPPPIIRPGSNYLAFGDVDSDGDLDLIMGSSNDATGYFQNIGTAEAPYYLRATPEGVVLPGLEGQDGAPALVDLDGDGDLDLILGKQDGTLAYFQQTGTAAAPAFTEQTGTSNPFGNLDLGDRALPAVGDLDADGDLDLVVGVEDGRVYHIENLGNPQSPDLILRGTLMVAPDVDRAAPVLADLDADGDLDLVVGQEETTFPGILLFDNTGTAQDFFFTRRPNTSNPFRMLPGIPSSKPALADLDGDGDLDLAVGGPSIIKYAENVGSASTPDYNDFADVESSPFEGFYVLLRTPSLGIGDLDGDLDLDLVLSTGGGFYTRMNMGNPQDPEFLRCGGCLGGTGNQALSPALGDLDGDADLDLIVGEADGSLSYFRNLDVENGGGLGEPDFVASGSSPVAGIDVGDRSKPELVDLDADGDLDLAVGTEDGTLVYFENTGTATAASFVEQTNSSSPFDGFDVGTRSDPSFADLEGDGDIDLVVGSGDGTLAYFENTGSSSGASFEQLAGQANPFDGIDVGSRSTPAFADLDGDSVVELLVGNDDGYFTYLVSGVTVDAEPSSGAPSSALLLDVYPNPAIEGVFRLQVRGLENQPFEISLYSVIGREIYNATSGAATERKEVTLRLPHLSSGIYIISVSTPGSRSTQRLTVVN